jgi:rod shape-determining protein MreD
MKNIIFLLAAIFSVTILQVTAVNCLKIFGVRPDLLIAFVVLASIRLNWKTALLFSVLAGLLKDLFGAAGSGLNIFLMPLWGYLILKISKKVSIDDPIGICTAAFLAALLNGIASRLLYSFLGKYIGLGIFLRIAFIEPLYTALSLLVFFKAADYIKHNPKFRLCAFSFFKKPDLTA